MHLWQLDLVGGIFLVGDRECKMLTGIDDHSRFVVVTAALEKPSCTMACEVFIAAIPRWGVPFEVLTDNGNQFTGKFTRPLPVESLFKLTCPDHGITARLTKRRSPSPARGRTSHHRQERAGPPDPATRTSRRGQSVHHERSSSNDRRTNPRPQSLDIATPTSSFRARQDDEPTHPPTVGASAAAAHNQSRAPLRSTYV